MFAHLLRPGHRSVTFGQPFTVDRKAPVEQITADLRQRMLALASPKSRAEAEAAEESSTQADSTLSR